MSPVTSSLYAGIVVFIPTFPMSVILITSANVEEGAVVLKYMLVGIIPFDVLDVVIAPMRAPVDLIST